MKTFKWGTGEWAPGLRAPDPVIRTRDMTIIITANAN